VFEFVREHEFEGALLGSPMLVAYLLLPSTGRRFSRAQTLRQPRP